MTPNNYVKSVVRDDAGRVVRQDFLPFNDGDAEDTRRAERWAVKHRMAGLGVISVFRSVQGPLMGPAVIGFGGGF